MCGPQGYIAYPSTIDVAAFLALVADYTATEQAYKETWGITSDCSVVDQPTSVTCVNNEPVLVY